MKMRWQAVPGVTTGRPEATLAKPRSDAAMLTVDGRICGSQTAPCADGLCDCSDAASGIQLGAL